MSEFENLMAEARKPRPAWRALTERFGVWLYVSVALVVLVAFISAPTLGVMLKVGAKATLGLWIGYWADRSAFPTGRPHEPGETADSLGPPAEEEPAKVSRINALELLGAAYMLRRAVLMAACVVGLTMGV